MFPDLQDLELRNLLDLALNTAGAGAFRADIENDRAIIDNRCREILGLHDEKFLTRDMVWGRVHPDDRQQFLENLTRTIKKQDSYRNAYRIIRPDGSARYILSQGRVLRRDDGWAVGIVGLIFDQTDKERTRRDLFIKTERYKQILDATGIGTWEWERETGRIVFNEQYANMLGYALTEFIPITRDTWRNLVHPDDLPKAERELSQHMQGQTPRYSAEFRARHKDGSWLWILSRGKVIRRNADGQPMQVTGTHTDISTIKAYEARLAASEARYRTVIEHMAEGLLFVDSDNRITASNPSARAILELTDAQMRNEAPRPEGWQYVDEDGAAIPIDQLPSRICMARGEPVLNRIVGVLKPTGETTWINVNAVPVALSHSESPGGVICTFADVTEHLRTQDRYRQALARAEAANQAKSSFLANMSHELRTPLNSIIGMSEIMHNEMFGPMPANYHEYAKLIHGSGQHLLEVISDILDMSKIEAGKMELFCTPTVLSELLDEVLAMLRPAASLKNLVLEQSDLHLAPVTVDRIRLRQVLTNVIGNAVKFTSQGAISISTATDPAGIRITVADTGPGMSAADISLALEPFGQVDGDAFTRRQEGTGLGLPLSAKIMELHGGSLFIDSDPGQGTRVHLLIPH